MNTPPVTSLNQVLLQVVSGVNPASGSGGTPSQLATIAAGTLITGNVYGRDAQGNTQLETPDGMISLKMDLFIRRGIEVVLRMEQVHKEIFARIVSVDGKSLSKYMESIGMQAPQQDSITHSNPLLQATPDKAAPLPSSTTAPVSGQPQPAENAATLKAILLSPPFLDETVPLPALQQAVSALPAEIDSLPPEIKLILLKAAIGTVLKIEIQKLELPQQIPLQAGNIPSSPQPNPLPATPSIPIGGAERSAALPPQTLGTLPTASLPAAATPLIHTAMPLPGNAASTLPTTAPPAQPATPVAVNAAISSTIQPSVNIPPVTPAPMQIAPAGVAHILNQTQQVVETLTTPLPAQTLIPTPDPAVRLNSIPTTSGTTAPNTTSLLQENVVSTSQYQPSMPAQANQAYRPFAPMGMEAERPLPAPSTPLPGVATPSALQAAPNSPVTLAQSPVFQATVIASTPDGQITLQTPMGVLNLISPTPLPAGTRLSFTLQAIEPPVEESGLTATIPVSSKTFKGLGDITNLPYPIPYAAQGMEPPRLIPRPGPALASEILFLLAALKGGDVRKWLGAPNSSELEKSGKGDLLQRISQDFSILRGGFSDAPSPGSWVQGTIPLFHQGLQSIQWFQKQGGQQEGKEKSRSSFDEHFLVDFHLTQLGHMQLDGMVKRTHPGYSFDLTVRSESALTPAMHREIQSIYSEAQQIGGFKGMLVFRAGLDACVKLETFYTGNTSDQPPHSILA